MIVLLYLMELVENPVAMDSKLIYRLKSVGPAIKGKCAISNT
jgi:hypothetical protein